jgi:hypothetical protein
MPADMMELALKWDVWAIHGIEPDDTAKRAVEQLGLSTDREHVGRTAAILARLVIRVPVDDLLS